MNAAHKLYLRLALGFGGLLFLTLGLGLTAFATSFAVRPLPQTVKDTPVIVRGKTGVGYSDWGRGPDANRRIYTYYDLRVEEVIKGSVTDQTIVIRELGGEKDGIGMQIAGSAQFEKGEEVVVMLSEKNSDSSYDVQGLMTGKFNIKQDESGQEVLVGALPEESGHGEIGGQTDPTSVKKWTLEGLRRLVTEQAKGGADQKSADLQGVPNSKSSLSAAAPSLHNSTQGVAPTVRSEVNASDTSRDSRGRTQSWVWGAIFLVGLLGIGAILYGRKS